MQKRIITLTLFLSVLLFSLPFMAAGESSVLSLLAGESAEINCDGQMLSLSRESRTKVRADCQADSATPTDQPEPEPSDTPEPPPTDEPSGVALCPDHDPIKWHALYDAERNCHYKHTHNGNPHELDHIFGPVGEWHVGQSISYPWATPHENEAKHEGYKWEVKEHAGCVIPEGKTGYDTCVTAWRIQFHAMGGPLEATATRLHSFAAELRVCTKDGAQCGIVKTGGWADFGILEVPYKGAHVPLPVDPPAPEGGFNVHIPPYRGHPPLDGVPKAPGGTVPFTWNSDSKYGYNQIFEFDFKGFDDWQGIDPNDPGKFAFICPDYQCQYNHSQMGIYHLVVSDVLPANNNGLVNFTGYTDRFGNIVTGCNEIGLDCIPLLFESVPKGTAMMTIPPNESPIEYDTSPPGEWWIEYSN